MLTQEQRATMSALWLARWHRWEGSGVSMAEYARREGFAADAAYRWRRVLRRTEQWVQRASMMLHLVLTNGRRAELEIGGIAQLGEMIGALERAA